MDKKTVKKVSSLARLKLEENQVERFAKELSSVFSHIEKLSNLQLKDVPATTHTHGAMNVMRPDEVEPSLSVDELKRIAPDHSGRYIRVKLIVE